MARPSEYTPALCNEVINLMAEDVPVVVNNKWHGVSEIEWCAFAMSRSYEWLPVVGKSAFDSYDLEYQVSFDGSSSRKSGLSRFDAVGWRNGKATIIEAKVNATLASLMGGVGQILSYKQIASTVYGWEVEDLILISPSWPKFFLETVAANALPVTLVMATPEMFYCRRSNGEQ